MKIFDFFKKKPPQSDDSPAIESRDGVGLVAELTETVRTADVEEEESLLAEDVDLNAQNTGDINLTQNRGGGQMTEELITQDNLSVEFLKSILDAAFLETSLDKDGDIIVHDQVRCYVLPNLERKDRVRFLTIFGFKPEASELKRLQAVNRINAEYIIVKATADNNDTLRFMWDLPIAGGMTKKAFVLALKRFCGIPRAAITDCANEVAA